MVSWLRLVWGSSISWAVICRLSMPWGKGLLMPPSSRDKLRCLPWGGKVWGIRLCPGFGAVWVWQWGSDWSKHCIRLYCSHLSRQYSLQILTRNRHPTIMHFSLGFNRFQFVSGTISPEMRQLKQHLDQACLKDRPSSGITLSLTHDLRRGDENCSTLLYNNPTFEASQNFTIPSLQICTPRQEDTWEIYLKKTIKS